MTVVIRTAHSSGRFDRSGDLLRRSINRLRDTTAIVTGTEAMGRPNTLLRARGWGLAHPPAYRGECWATWDESRFQPAGKPRAPILSKMVWRRSAKYGGKLARPVRVLIVPLRDQRTRGRVFVLVTHMPLSNTALRRLVWTKCAAGLVRRVRRLQRRHPTAVIIVHADWNKDWRNPADRQQLKRLARRMGLQVGWARVGILPQGGTHGNRRLIDGCMATRIESQRLLADDASSDHRPYLTRVAGRK